MRKRALAARVAELEADRTRLRILLADCVAAFDAHDSWCGYNPAAPGNARAAALFRDLRETIATFDREPTRKTGNEVYDLAVIRGMADVQLREIIRSELWQHGGYTLTGKSLGYMALEELSARDRLS
jgi:hypothetical protein